MEKLIIGVIVILTSCFFGSIMHFSEKDIGDTVNTVINPSFEDGEYNSETLPEKWNHFRCLSNKPGICLLFTLFPAD
jgi:hypothetical protein